MYLFVVIAISTTDIFVQALSNATTASAGVFKYSNIVVVGIHYSLLVSAILILTCSRFIRVRRALRGISKSHTPTCHLPKKVLLKVQHGFYMTSRVIPFIKPLSSDINHSGWANPDNIAFEGVDLKRAVARTPIIIENAAMRIGAIYSRPSFVEIRLYINFLIQHGIMDKAFGCVYLEGYESARFSKYGPTEDEYMNIMRHLATILNQMGYYLQGVTSKLSVVDIHQHNNILISDTSNQHLDMNKRYGESRRSPNSQTSSRSRQSVFTYKQHRNNNNNSVYSSTYGNLAYCHHNKFHTPFQPHSTPDEDDVISLAQSVATWASRTSQQRSHLENRFFDEQKDGYDERMRHVIYDRLMKPHIQL
ncbi:hypothetical protein BCR42DRAFT_486982 [Absidia repens]|uniref:Defect at low temperature protein 1 n=1 Tax=Absidia repens TaxID=90262 RepID=A0A1X2IZN7_9FUNG|nr:hypothetical protein BCR42DRAFT_486982 [Absidia repens]